MKTRRSGFTLIEMMVVIGIIGILAAVLAGGYTYAVKSAQRAKATEAVSNARTALELLYEKVEGWPKAITDSATVNEQGFKVMDENVAKLLFQYGLLNVDGYKEKDLYKVRGVDRCGIADPWAQEVLRNLPPADKNLPGQSLLTRTVPSGGTVKDHLIYFAVDENEDGFVDSSEHAPVNRVRAKVITWSAGADGGLGDCKTDKPGKKSYNGRMVSNQDNVYSWQRAQEVR